MYGCSHCYGNLLSPTGGLYSQTHFLKHLVEHQDVTEGGGAKMYVGRSRHRTKHLRSPLVLRKPRVQGCGWLLRNASAQTRLFDHNTSRLRLTSLTQLDAPPLIPDKLKSLLSKRSPEWWRAIGVAEVPLIPDGLTGAAVTKVRYESWHRSCRCLYPLQHPTTISSAKNHGKGNRNSQHSHRRMNHSFAPFTQATPAALLGMHHGWDVSLQRCHYSTFCEPPSLEGSGQSGWVNGIQNDFHHCWGNRSRQDWEEEPERRHRSGGHSCHPQSKSCPRLAASPE